MIRIKSVDAQNILAVCELTSNQSCAVAAANGRPHCNALSIAEAKYNPEMHPNAIYNNNVLIGFSCTSARRTSPRRQPSAASCSAAGSGTMGLKKRRWSMF